MLRKAAARSCEIYVSYLEKGYDPQNKHEFSPEFEKHIQDLKMKRGQVIWTSSASSSKSDRIAYSYQNGNNKCLLPF